MEQVNINVTKVEKEVTINATPNVTQIIVTTQSGGGGGIPDAPNNSNAYVRSALNWVVGYTKTAIDTLLNGKVDKVNGKSLINDTEISRLASMTAIFTNDLKNAYDGAVVLVIMLLVLPKQSLLRKRIAHLHYKPLYL